MSLLYLYFITLGLSAKTFSVTVLSSVLKPIGLKIILKIALIFAVIQILLAILGWFSGLLFSAWLEQYSSSLAYSILTIVGIKMVISTFKLKSRLRIVDSGNNIELLILSVATGIDIFIAAIALGLIDIPLSRLILLLGIIIFLVSVAGASFGKKYPMKYGNLVEFIGGLIIIFIGMRYLIELMN